MIGWGLGIRKGDYLILDNDLASSTTRYQITKILYFNDPHDMWSAEVKFAPRLNQEEETV
jgi:hypothetical protein